MKTKVSIFKVEIFNKNQNYVSKLLWMTQNVFHPGSDEKIVEKIVEKKYCATWPLDTLIHTIEIVNNHLEIP